MPAEDVVHPLDQLDRQLDVAWLSRGLGEAEEIAHCERVGPQVALLRTVADETGPLGELHHELDRFFGARLHGGPGGASVEVIAPAALVRFARPAAGEAW